MMDIALMMIVVLATGFFPSALFASMAYERWQRERRQRVAWEARCERLQSDIVAWADWQVARTRPGDASPFNTGLPDEHTLQLALAWGRRADDEDDAADEEDSP